MQANSQALHIHGDVPPPYIDIANKDVDICGFPCASGQGTFDADTLSG